MSIVLEKDLLTGNELIDSEHRELIDRINKLVDSCENGKEKMRIPFQRRREASGRIRIS